MICFSGFMSWQHTENELKCQVVILQFISARIVIIDLKIQSNQVWSKNEISEAHLCRKQHKTKKDDLSFQFV